MQTPTAMASSLAVQTRTERWSPTTSPNDLNDRMIDALNDHDAEAFARLFAEKATFVSILGQQMIGRSGITVGLTAIFETLLTGTRLNIHGVNTVPFGPIWSRPGRYAR